MVLGTMVPSNSARVLLAVRHHQGMAYLVGNNAAFLLAEDTILFFLPTRTTSPLPQKRSFCLSAARRSNSHRIAALVGSCWQGRNQRPLRLPAQWPVSLLSHPGYILRVPCFTSSLQIRRSTISAVKPGLGRRSAGSSTSDGWWLPGSKGPLT